MRDHEVNKLIDAIQSYLDGGVAPSPAEVVALDYAQECREVNDRLARIAMILGSDGELEALQVAEAEPRLIDRAILLSFGLESAWAEYCERHGNEIAPMIEAATLETLEELYQRGMSPKHPLYKQYRGAVLSRKNDEAYELIKIITRLNPKDANAKRELKRHEHKMVVRLLGELEEALQNDDDDEVLYSLTLIESAHSNDDYKESAVYQNAVSRRAGIRKASAQAEIPRMLDSAEDELAGGGDWRSVAQIHSGIEGRIEKHSISLHPGDALRFDSIGKQLDKMRSEAERMAEISTLCEEMKHIAEDVEVHSVTPDGLDHEFASESLEKLLKCQRQMRSLRGDLQLGDQARVDGAMDQLNHVLKRRRSQRKIRLVTLSAVAVVALLTASVFGWLSLQATKRVKLLTNLENEGQSQALSKQIQKIKDSDPILLKFPKLSSQVAISEQWIKGKQSTAAKVNKLLDKLEAESNNEYKESNPKEIFERMAEAKVHVDKLPGDLNAEARARLAIIQNEADRYLVATQKKAAKKANAILKDVAAQMDSIDPAGYAKKAKMIVDASLTLLAPLVKMSEESVPILRLPVSVESQVKDKNTHLQHLLQKSETVLNALAEVKKARSLTDLEAKMKVLDATDDYKEAEEAKRVMEVLPNDQKMKAFLLFQGDLASLAAAEQMVLTDFPRPEAAMQTDRDIISNLSSNPSLVDLWDIHWTRKGKPRHAYSKGELKRYKRIGRYTKTTYREWYGEVAEQPKYKGGGLTFKKYTRQDPFILESRDELLKSNELTEVSRMISMMAVDHILDDTGTEYRRSIVPLIGQVFRNRKAPPMAKAYVVNVLFRLVRGRELEWGGHFVPSLIDDMTAARVLEMDGVIKPTDWMTPGTSELDKKWTQYFETRYDRHYFRELTVFQALVKSLISEPISIAALVDSDRSVSLHQVEVPRVIWGMCENKEGDAEMQVLGVVEAQSTNVELPPNILPMSPLFAIKLEDSTQRELLLNRHKIKQQN